MLEWILNTPLKPVEHNLIWIEKIRFLIDFHFDVFPHIFLYLQFIRRAFSGDLWETLLNIIKFIFDVCKELERETVKAKINDALLRIFLKK